MDNYQTIDIPIFGRRDQHIINQKRDILKAIESNDIRIVRHDLTQIKKISNHESVAKLTLLVSNEDAMLYRLMQ